jgi:hypothetical protein
MTDQHPERGDPVDEPIDEIRAIRRQISAECGHDPAILVSQLIEWQQRPEIRSRLIAAPRIATIDKPAA